MPKAQVISQEGEWKESEGRKVCANRSSGHDIALTFMNFQKLCVPVRDLHKIKTVKIPSRKGGRTHEVPTLAGSLLLAADGY